MSNDDVNQGSAAGDIYFRDCASEHRFFNDVAGESSPSFPLIKVFLPRRNRNYRALIEGRWLVVRIISLITCRSSTL